jgi:hypothetical protein
MSEQPPIPRVGLVGPELIKYNGIIKSLHDIERTLGGTGDKFYTSYAFFRYKELYGYCLGLIRILINLVKFYKKSGVKSTFEVMCGRGIMRILLHRYISYYGCKYECSDYYDPHDVYATAPSELYNRFPHIPRPVKSDAIEKIKSITDPNSAVLISFAPLGTSMGADCLSAILENPNVCYVISLHDQSCVATEEYYNILDDKFEIVGFYDIFYVASMEYKMGIYVKK